MDARTIDRELRNLHRLARLMDGRFRVPFSKVRFGLDSILGLLPAGGDAAMAIVGLYVVYKAQQLGASRETLARMLVNVGVDALIGTVPIAGDVADVFFKSNIRNVALLEKELGWSKERPTAREKVRNWEQGG